MPTSLYNTEWVGGCRDATGQGRDAGGRAVCGIVGKVCDRRIDEDLIKSMCHVIEHRGPDSRGTFIGDGVGLGIQRLAVIDLATGDQPILNEDGSVVVVLNGEIYNFRELRRELEERGHRFATRSDTEVIVHLYEDHGEACVERLRGMFAFALWDMKSKRLLLARDRVGKKPLFYAHCGGTFWFGSAAKAILQDPEVSRDPDFKALDCYLHYGYVPHPHSAFAALRKLPPAHTLTLEEGRVDVRRYWRLSYRDSPLSPAEAHQAIRSAVLEATRLRLRSDVPLGAFLSGGVDSSAVVAAMAQLASGRMKTFSIGFDVDTFDETPYAREVAQLFDTEHHEFRVTADAVAILPRLVWHYGEPFSDHSAIPSFYLSELTRAHVTVALNGDGGDESFAGYNRYFGNALTERLDWIPAALGRAAAGVMRRIGTGPNMDSNRARLLRVAEALPLAPAERYSSWMSIFSERERAALYAPETRASIDLTAAREIVARPYQESDASNEVERLLDVDVRTWLPGDLLVKMDIASMAESLEVRSPLLDQELMQLAAALPVRMKLDGRATKAVFKDAVRAWLPDHILDRPKQGFSIPLSHWLRNDLRHLPREILLDSRTCSRGLFRKAAVERLIADHLDRRADNANRLWTLIQLELWFRTFVDRASHEPLPALDTSVIAS